MSNKTALHPMAVVSRKTGLGPDLIRAWERRYQAIRPARTATNRRLYSDAEIGRLILMRRAIEAGWQIGQLATLEDERIRALIENDPSVEAPPWPPASDVDAETGWFVVRCLKRIEQLDGSGLQRELETASVELGRVRLLNDLLTPLMERVGDACAAGTLRIAHEHLASTAVRSFMDSVRGAYPAADIAPTIVVTTPNHQHHELAAVLVMATARADGWQVNYLGPSLPAEEIAAATSRPGVRVLALSITFGVDDPPLEAELAKIGRLVPDEVNIVVGGRAAPAYDAVLERIGALRIADLATFRDFLTNLRSNR